MKVTATINGCGPRPKVLCPICSDLVAVRLDGTLRRHSRGYGQGSWWCPGSTKPVGDGVTAEDSNLALRS